MVAGSKDSLKDWVTPAVAFARAKAVFPGPNAAMDALGVRIRDGLLKVAAREAITVTSGEPDRTGKNVIIEKILWAHLKGGWSGQPHLWTAGQVDIWTERGEVRVSLHDVLFDPVGLDDYLRPLEAQLVKLVAGRTAPVAAAGTAAAPPAAPSPSPAVVPTVPDTRRPVSKPHLEAWAKLFVQLHKNEDFSEPFAVNSAQGMFHDKVVGRDRVRIALKDAGWNPTRGPKKRIE